MNHGVQMGYPNWLMVQIIKNCVLRGRRHNGFLGLSLNDSTIIFLVILLDKTVSFG